MKERQKKPAKISTYPQMLQRQEGKNSTVKKCRMQKHAILWWKAKRENEFSCNASCRRWDYCHGTDQVRLKIETIPWHTLMISFIMKSKRVRPWQTTCAVKESYKAAGKSYKDELKCKKFDKSR